MNASSKKVTQIVNYLVNSSDNHELDKWSAVKLAYFADRYHMRKYGRSVSGDLYVAMKKGPVGSLIKDVVECTDYLGDNEAEYVRSVIKQKDEDSNTIVSLGEVDTDQFSKTDIEALEFAVNNFSSFSKEELIELTHEYPEWQKFEKRLEADSAVEQMSYSDFFLNPENLDGDKFVDNEAALNLSKQMYEESKKCSLGASDN